MPHCYPDNSHSIDRTRLVRLNPRMEAAKALKGVHAPTKAIQGVFDAQEGLAA